jgi:hypothetical protein
MTNEVCWGVVLGTRKPQRAAQAGIPAKPEPSSQASREPRCGGSLELALTTPEVEVRRGHDVAVPVSKPGLPNSRLDPAQPPRCNRRGVVDLQGRRRGVNPVVSTRMPAIAVTMNPVQVGQETAVCRLAGRGCT